MFKGQINKNGRKLGTPNKITADVRECFSNLLKNNLDLLQDDLEQLKPYERIKIILELAKFVIPTLKAVELNATENDNFKEIIFEFQSSNNES
jgi:hypothetical protein